MKRRDKHNYYLDIAQTVLKRGTCLRRNYGAIIVKNDEIIATGYTGAPRRRKNCIDIGVCRREQLSIPRGERYELCRSVHAEANCIISASRNDMLGSTMYLTGIDVKTESIIEDASSCAMCKRLIINSGIDKLVIRNTADNYTVVEVQSWVDNDETLENVFGY
ncbi:MAG: deaminase [Firmicutes bacterium]|nr:deaminase [Bacillota bacterium]